MRRSASSCFFRVFLFLFSLPSVWQRLVGCAGQSSFRRFSCELAAAHRLSPVSGQEPPADRSVWAIQLSLSNPVISGYIGSMFGMWIENKYLLQSCREILNKNDIHENDVSAVIIKELWKKLKRTHTLRIIK